jgi:hypothetical protein
MKEWKAKGKVKIVHAMGGLILKKKTPLLGEWFYDSGIISRRVLFKKIEFDIRDLFELVRPLDNEDKYLSALKGSREITPTTLTAWRAGAIWGRLSEKKAMEKMMNIPAVEIFVKNEAIILEMYGAKEIMKELVVNFPN